MSDFFDFVVIPAIVVLIIVALAIGLIAGFQYTLNKNYCERMEKLAPAYNFDFSFWGGCLVQTNSGYWSSAYEYFNRLEFVPVEK